ncbi:MAG: hypothetical protein REV35_02280 [Burkholderia sp.]|nr:hypothetical protein [Burkholderia sp.]
MARQQYRGRSHTIKSIGYPKDKSTRITLERFNTDLIVHTVV